MVPVEGENGKIDAGEMARQLKANTGHGVHSYLPSAVSLTQSTECGTVYTPDEIAAVTANWPLLTKESALLLDLSDGAYSALIQSPGNGGSGEVVLGITVIE